MDSLINEYFAASSEKRADIAQQLASETSGPGILSLVKALQSQLTGSDEGTRADATQCLADVLAKVPLAPDQHKLLWMFFCDRLADGKSFASAITGLQVLQTGDVQQLRKAIEASSFRRQPQIARHEAFKLLRTLTSDASGVDLYLEMASGEKDPQNLLLTLEMASKFLQNDNLTPAHREELFDATFCYFPITFKPPKDMHYAVDVQEIKRLLRRAISSPSIAQFVVPALISKLNAVNPEIKADVLLTLNEVLRSYSPETLSAYWLPVWDSLKFEILHGSPENESNAAVFEILQVLLPIQDFLEAVRSDVAQIDPSKRALALQICHLVAGLANSQPIFTQLSHPVLEQLLKDQQAGYLEYINVLALSKHALPGEYHDQLLSLYMSGLAAQDHYAVAIIGVAPLAMHVREFTPILVQALSQHLPDSRAITVLGTLARIDSNAVLSECFSLLFAKIGGDEAGFDAQSKLALQILAQIATTKELVNALTIRLCSRAELITDDVPYLFEILDTILTAIKAVDLADLTRYSKYIHPLLPLFFCATPAPAFLAEIVIDRMSQIMELTVRALPEQQQAEYAEEICRLVWPQNSCVFGHSPSSLSYLVTGCLVGINEDNLPLRFQISFVKYSEVLRRTQNVFQRAGCLRYLAIGVNKWPHRFGDVQLALKWLRTSIETGQDAVSNLEILAWVCKGLVLRNDQLGFETCQYITDLVVSRPLGEYAARVFGLLISDDHVLCKENRVAVRLLYKQKLFLQALPDLLKGFNGTDNVIKLNSTTAFSALVRFTPLKVLQQHLDKVMPVIIECLDLNLAPSSQNGALMTIASTISQEGALTLYDTHVERVVDLCLKLALASPNATTRSKAIEVLYLVAVHMPRSSVKPFAARVLAALPEALGDVRRDVRKQASRSIQAYHIL